MTELKVVSKKYNDRDELIVENFEEEIEKSSVSVVKALKGQDISVEGITSKGIANTGAFGNIGNVAISGDLSASGDITAKTLEQSEANWSLPVTSFGAFGGLTANIVFARIQKLNQELEIVVLVSYTNETESNITGYSTGLVYIELPESISSKIFDCEGNNITGDGGDKYISSVSAWASRRNTSNTAYSTGAPRLFIINGTTSNCIGITFTSPTQMQVDAGGTTIMEARLQLTLI